MPLYGEHNVGFSQTFANLLLRTLPSDHGVVVLNTGVGGTGFSDGRWVVPNGPLTVQSIAAVKRLAAALPNSLGGTFHLHAMLWHQGEEDAGDNRVNFHASYCQYLVNDLTSLIDHLRGNFPGASEGTPFLDGGMLPYWVDAVNGTEGESLDLWYSPLVAHIVALPGVMSAIYGLNTSRPCTGTADSRVFPDYFPGTKTPDGEPGYRSGVTGDVIHFNATQVRLGRSRDWPVADSERFQAVVMGYQYWAAYQRAISLTTVVQSAKTNACANHTSPSVSQCRALR